MYKHILIPTDGSRLSDKAIRTAVELARKLGAKLTAMHAVPPLQHGRIRLRSRTRHGVHARRIQGIDRQVIQGGV